MIDSVEFGIIDEDARRDTPVVIRRDLLSHKWLICHARSHKLAFAKDIAHFDTRDQAVEFAEDHDCEVLN